MTSINTTSLHQFSSQFHKYSSNNISDEYKKNLFLAQIAREDRRANTQNSVENVVETAQEEQNVSNISNEAATSQSAEYATPKTGADTPDLRTNSSEKDQTYDNTINQLKAQKNELHQELDRLNQKGSSQATFSNQGGKEGTTQDVEATISSSKRLLLREEPLANLLKRQIDEIEQEINRKHNNSTISENANLHDGLSLSQMRQKKTRLEQQLRNLENETTGARGLGLNTNRTPAKVAVEEGENSQYQNHLEELRIKQEIRNLEGEINTLERKKIINKTQAALNEIRNISNETTRTEDHSLEIEV